MMACLALVACSSSAFNMPLRPAMRTRAASTQMSFDLASSYLNALNDHYLPTTCLQAGVLGSIGDVLAQAIDRNETASSLDWQRACRTGTLGVVIGGIGDAMWLRYLEEPGLFEPIIRTFDRFGADHGVALDPDVFLVVIKTTLDAFVWAPIANSLYLVLTPLSEGVDLTSVVDSLVENFLPVMQSEWSVFLPYNLLAFALFPPFIRPFTTGFVSMLFSTYLSWITHLEPRVQATAEGLNEGLGEQLGELLVPVAVGGTEGALPMADAQTLARADMARDARAVMAAIDRIDDDAKVVLAMDAVGAARAMGVHDSAHALFEEPSSVAVE
jgi:hypothetical protein